jgi:hypothetical protein
MALLWSVATGPTIRRKPNDSGESGTMVCSTPIDQTCCRSAAVVTTAAFTVAAELVWTNDSQFGWQRQDSRRKLFSLKLRACRSSTQRPSLTGVLTAITLHVVANSCEARGLWVSFPSHVSNNAPAKGWFGTHTPMAARCRPTWNKSTVRLAQSFHSRRASDNAFCRYQTLRSMATLGACV